MLKHEGDHCKFTKKARLPHCFNVVSGVASFFFQFAWNRRETLGK